MLTSDLFFVGLIFSFLVSWFLCPLWFLESVVTIGCLVGTAWCGHCGSCQHVFLCFKGCLSLKNGDWKEGRMTGYTGGMEALCGTRIYLFSFKWRQRGRRSLATNLRMKLREWIWRRDQLPAPLACLTNGFLRIAERSDLAVRELDKETVW